MRTSSRLCEKRFQRSQASMCWDHRSPGPLALMLAEAEPDKIRGVILATTFVRPPRRIYVRMRFTSVAPTIWLIRTCRHIPAWLSRGPTDQLRRDTAEIWKRVAAHIVAARIRSLLNVDARELLGGVRLRCCASQGAMTVSYPGAMLRRSFVYDRPCLCAGSRGATSRSTRIRRPLRRRSRRSWKQRGRLNSATWMLKGLMAGPVTQKLLILSKPHGIAYVGN